MDNEILYKSLKRKARFIVWIIILCTQDIRQIIVI